ncbi:MAG: GNAT family N-acetyltransferase [Cytophagaceae bacterium]|nr:GNAT family N-acetyltransferase [Cytophagaceae bacterium]|tara:strand:- start:6179 stop:6616 length:438 start_codon:yes stop_codon:yes gene_type:complete
MQDFSFRFINREQSSQIIPFFQLLDSAIPVDVLNQRLDEMYANRFNCLGIFDQDKLIGICGIWVLYKYYIGKHLELDDVIISADYRNKGVGKQMMQFIESYAKQNDCMGYELNCYVHNAPGVKFWANQNMVIKGYHFQKKFQTNE